VRLFLLESHQTYPWPRAVAEELVPVLFAEAEVPAGGKGWDLKLEYRVWFCRQRFVKNDVSRMSGDLMAVLTQLS